MDEPRFWLLADAAHWRAHDGSAWHAGCRRLRLASVRTLEPALDDAAAAAVAAAAVEAVPRAVDAAEHVASWDAAAQAIVVQSTLPGLATRLPLPETPTDLCAGADGVLYIALPGRVRLHDLRARWLDADVSLPGFAPWRLAAAADGGVWVLERASGRLARLQGQPLPAQTPDRGAYDPRVFRPDPENGRTPTLQLVAEPTWPAGDLALALASPGAGSVAVLVQPAAEAEARLVCFEAARGRYAPALRLAGARHAYGLTWLDATRVALRVPGRTDLPAYALPAAGEAVDTLQPLGEIFPCPVDAPEAPFTNGAARPPSVPVGERGAQPLHALSLQQFARRGEARHYSGPADALDALMLDSGDATTVWHRLYAEASIPPHTAAVVWLAATNDPQPPPADDLVAWHPHGFGADAPALDPALRVPQVPRAAWQREPSELPAHPGLLDGDRVPGRRGLFGVWIQAARERVRPLRGRFLWLRVVLHGDGRATPEIAALRAYAGRVDLVERHLPRLYRETLSGDAAHAPGQLITRIDLEFVAALDAGGAVPAALRERLAADSLGLPPEARITRERRGFAWRLADGAATLRLQHDGDAIGVYRVQASAPDFLSRLVGSFDSLLAPLEARIAQAHLMTDPAAIPEAGLDWLAGWIGVAFDPALPAARRRDWLRAAPALARSRGTRDGLRLALDVATGGGVRGGELVVIEDFRLRRIAATLLGVDLVDEHDPLLPGLTISGNSIVGDTLVLSDTERAELVALFRDDVAIEADDRIVQDFHRRLAHRATVLVHREVEATDFALVRRIVQLEAPAHVQVRVVAATRPLMVGLQSLLGVDTYLGPPRERRAARVEQSQLGGGDVLTGPAVLDPRIGGAPAGASLAAFPAPDALRLGGDRAGGTLT